MSTEHAPEPRPALEVSVHGHPNANTVLLWHPAIAHNPEPVTALASRIATRSRLRVVVPTWTAESGDTAGSDLLRSVRFARESTLHPPDQLTIVGYGVAGIAALSLAQHQRRMGIGLARVTCVDGAADLIDPISGQPLPSPVTRPEQVSTAVDIVETDDGWARATTAAWRTGGWAATLIPQAQFTWRVSPSQ